MCGRDFLAPTPSVRQPLFETSEGNRVQKRGVNLWRLKRFFAPTPSVRQPLFETSDSRSSVLSGISYLTKSVTNSGMQTGVGQESPDDCLIKFCDSPYRKRSPAKGVWQKTRRKSDRSIRKSDPKSDRKSPENEKSDRTPFVVDLLLRHPERQFIRSLWVIFLLRMALSSLSAVATLSSIGPHVCDMFIKVPLPECLLLSRDALWRGRKKQDASIT